MRWDRRKQGGIEGSMREKYQRKVIKKACHGIRKSHIVSTELSWGVGDGGGAAQFE
jgi:hypothetical protein